jgi:hypothetical protein
MTRRDLFALTPALILSGASAGCSSEPKHKAPVKPAEPVTGLHALYQCYQHARQWSTDLKVVRLTSINLAEVKSQPGKVAGWQAVFASEALGQKRAYTFSVFDASISMRKGVFPEPPTALGSDDHSFVIAALQKDTDVAIEVAMKHGEAYAKKNPNMPISYTLELGRKILDPMWRVIWGESANTSSYSILVDASTGQYVETLN